MKLVVSALTAGWKVHPASETGRREEKEKERDLEIRTAGGYAESARNLRRQVNPSQ